jgi:hypothetical protein
LSVFGLNNLEYITNVWMKEFNQEIAQIVHDFRTKRWMQESDNYKIHKRQPIFSGSFNIKCWVTLKLVLLSWHWFRDQLSTVDNRRRLKVLPSTDRHWRGRHADQIILCVAAKA